MNGSLGTAHLKKQLLRRSSGWFPLLEYFNVETALNRIGQHYENGHAHYIRDINASIVTDIAECEKLWNTFSPRKSIFDLWEFRHSFYKGFGHQPYFITLSRNGKLIGVLPLSLDTGNPWSTDTTFTWFGSSWCEDNSFFVSDPEYIPLLLFLAPNPTVLTGISKDVLAPLENLRGFNIDESKFKLNLEESRTPEAFLQRLKKKTRHNLRRDRHALEKLHPEIVINRFDDFDHLVRLSIERFKSKGEESTMEYPSMVNVFKNLIQNTGNYEIRMVSVVINNHVVGTDLIALYNNSYYALIGGADIAHFPGLGNYQTMIEIEDALANNQSWFDVLQEPYSWKKRLFTEYPMLMYDVDENGEQAPQE